ncbi:hypothetical protein HOLleu_04318 [Holothuria leucospilota]|uniref:Uncharacterized protein n=1 Tax=Holothuria leucospilota TaxID=206669 RepID=A0A9Q1CUA7_HOLLE|nr:hypothetical protein HOLleu_04318 [Holothuria leucospilota]
MDDEEVVVSAIAVFIGISLRKKKRKAKEKKKRTWAKPWLMRKKYQGAFQNLETELTTEDPKQVTNFRRMDDVAYSELLQKITPFITRKDTVMRQAIGPGERLSITLRYLATGQSYKSLAYLYRVSPASICTIIPETCTAIFEALKNTHMKVMLILSCSFL